MTMNEIFVVGYGILVFDTDYDFFEGFVKEFNLAHNTEYNVYYDQYNETKPIFICKTGLIKLNYEPFKMDELKSEISFEDYQNLKKIKSTFSECKDDDIILISKPSWYIFNYLS